jgi:aspartate beta-hydroxylase
LIDDEEIDYDEEDEEELGSEEEVSDIDDTDLMKRLEAKYGRISGENSEEDEDPDASWTSKL